MVNIFFRPGNQKGVKTKVVKNEQNPTFNETFRFQIPLAEVARKTLTMQVADWDRFSKNDPMGEVKITLSQLDLLRGVSKMSILQQVTEKGSSSDEEKRRNGHLVNSGESLI